MPSAPATEPRFSLLSRLGAEFQHLSPARHLSADASSASLLFLALLAFALLFVLPCLDRLAARRVQHDERVGVPRAAAPGQLSLPLDALPAQRVELLSPASNATAVWPQLRQRAKAQQTSSEGC
ncbi:hypothetical protein FA09DRAFT_186682 [Tilletiopsis washingtonensis]|jgi:hypothetical protein|uniref:Uncharacterized protein n=1 Tax=Tilletiopsis washingtonensis TaxID=58919 RepID=A0A316ZGT4_9BASI|nr:hypothetical protein FA09DRAFT_186682 [Tilletiopsis washingtonensis]PWO00457.1 hypothetical protein FA09DRAFT_186682 [Tilletiopsis washingtonensis]